MQKALPYPEYFKTLPKKFAGSGALFFDDAGRVLVLKTTYRDGWIIPGGIVDEDESPLQACVRECKEELGIDVSVGRLLCLDYKIKTDPALQDDSYQFIWDGGVLSPAEIEQIRLSEEHSEFRFVNEAEAMPLLNPKLAKRLPYCLKAKESGRFVYLEDGDPVV